ncbi:DUF3077 domain-containing protein [Pseudomonas rossensis]|uniref:DUF3077 domain-containing protein n=1 Tax=Pseudomonas rossensis TaxID=2305471 RepID=UPI003261CF77
MIATDNWSTICWTSTYHANQPLLRINGGAPVIQALSHAFDLLHVPRLNKKAPHFFRRRGIQVFARQFNRFRI